MAYYYGPGSVPSSIGSWAGATGRRRPGTVAPPGTPFTWNPTGTTVPGAIQPGTPQLPYNPATQGSYSSPSAPAPAAPAAPSRPTWDPNSDPMIAQIRAQSNRGIQQAKAQLLRLQKQELIGFGSQKLARSILGKDAVVNTISANPDQSFSFLANLKRQYGIPIGSAKGNWFGATRMGLIPEAEEALNQQNLWFGSYHTDALHALEQQKLQAQDVEQRRIQGLLAGYQDQYTQQVQAYQDAIMQAILQRQNALGAAV
jgi:hypothetical protein